MRQLCPFDGEPPNPWEVDNGKAFALLFRVWFGGCRKFAEEADCCCLFFGRHVMWPGEDYYIVFNGRLA